MIFLHLTKKLLASVPPSLQDLNKILSSSFIYEPIWIKISMNTNIMAMQFLKIEGQFILKSPSSEMPIYFD